MDTSVYVLDVGRVAQPPAAPALGWAGQRNGVEVTGDQASLGDLAFHVVADLRAGHRIALGFEASAWVPVPDDEARLLRARELADVAPGGAVSAWAGRYAVWGTARLLAQAPWLLGRIAEAFADEPGSPPVATLDRAEWGRDAPLLVFEAFVAGSAKPQGDHDTGHEHVHDARSAVDACIRSLSDLDGTEMAEAPVGPSDGVPFSVLGAAVLHAGLSDAIALLHTAPMLVRPSQPAPSR